MKKLNEFRVYFQCGLLVRDFGVISAKNEQEAIEKAIENDTDDDKEFYRDWATAKKIKNDDKR